jgi:serine/threonine-protein kinase
MEVDRRTDIFAVGIVLWELISGKRLFYGETDFHTVELVRKAQVPSLTSLNPQVNSDLEELIRTALARDVESRYQSARDFGDALAQYLFTHGVKVTSYDVARVVDEALAQKAAKAANRGDDSLIHDLIQEELVKFSSIGDTAKDAKKAESRSSDPLIDPRDWALLTGESSGNMPVAQPPQGAQKASSFAGGLADMIEPERQSQTMVPPEAPQKPQGGSNRALMIIAAVLVLLLGSAGVYAYLNGLIGGSSAVAAQTPPPPRSP